MINLSWTFNEKSQMWLAEIELPYLETVILQIFKEEETEYSINIHISSFSHDEQRIFNIMIHETYSSFDEAKEAVIIEFNNRMSQFKNEITKLEYITK